MADTLPQPTPRRYFDLNSTESSPPTSRPLDLSMLEIDPGEEPRRSGSALNLTSSTLFGIYSRSGDESGRSPFGTGAQTPRLLPGDDRLSSSTVCSKPVLPKVQTLRHRVSEQRRPSLFLRFPLLFICGMAYGVIITHLHDNQRLAPVKIHHIDRNSWRYLILWGTAGVILGGVLPWIDILWEEPVEETKAGQPQTPILSPIEGGEEDMRPSSSSGSANWNQPVRGIGAFVGIAFAIVSTFPLITGSRLRWLTELQRRLPWQSSLQVSLTLALVNPVLWYIIDRSKPGFFLSSFVGITGTAILLGLSPEMILSPPSPSPLAGRTIFSIDSLLRSNGLISEESIWAWTWIASVLFCSSVCFGNLGRRLALGQPGKRGNLLW